MKRKARAGTGDLTEGPSPTVGFRLDPDARRALDERAALFERSPHELARQLVLEKLLEGEDRQQLIETLSSLQSEIAELRAEFAHAVQVMLVSAGKINPEQAEAFVQQNFARSRS